MSEDSMRNQALMTIAARLASMESQLRSIASSLHRIADQQERGKQSSDERDE